ncbi:MAG TPA: zinc-binding dehydrogenase [Candidatus Bathyarchaeia archaeon]|nr:zinc-binding dehydrogenase [Candidatus Bathyarchaeia archaeon]
MLACLINRQGHAEITDVPVPRLKPGEVLIKLAAAGICGTDIEKVRGSYGPGGILGHEVSGTIASVGDEVTDLKESDRIIAHHHVPCYNCHYCQQGDHTMCDLFRKTNFDPCGLAEYFKVPETNVTRGGVVRLPPEASFEEGSMIEPTACCVRALDKAEVRRGDKVLVVGLGPTGLTQIQLVRRMGASRIIGVDILPHRLELARKLGADEAIDSSSERIIEHIAKSTGLGVDLAIVSTGNPKAIQPALDSIRKGGKLLLFGAPAQGSTINLDVGNLFSRQISIVTSYSCVESDIHRALEFLSNGEIDLLSMVTDRFALRDAPNALEHARASKTAVKTIIVPAPKPDG